MFSAHRSALLAFLQGVALDAYTTHQWAGKWGICLESRAAINQLQDLLTLVGVANAQVPKLNRRLGKTYYELYAAGPWEQEMVRLVPFLEPDKAARAAECPARPYRTGATDVIPGKYRTKRPKTARLREAGLTLRSFSSLPGSQTRFASGRSGFLSRRLGPAGGAEPRQRRGRDTRIPAAVREVPRVLFLDQPTRPNGPWATRARDTALHRTALPA